MLGSHSFGNHHTSKAFGVICDVDNQGEEFGLDQEEE
jgi:hypothetical protein